MGLSRRELLEGTTGIVAVLALGGCELFGEKIRNRPVRRDISSMSATDPTLQAYADAVAQMKALPTSDPRNWTRQAQIHQNFCPHGNWFFLPWHRAYLLSFERICQTLTGESSFGLPYWNWSCDRSIPAPFWVSGSPLNHSPRTATSASSALDSIVGPANMNDILSETDFELFASGAATDLRGGGGFYGRLEGEPHNYVHGFVGGTMGTFMSPLDPVFWTHHNIIDYFWFEWNQRGNANTNDPSYTDFDIAGQMVDGAGDPVAYRVGTLILAPLLSYRFQPPDPCGSLTMSVLESAALRRLLEEGAAIRFKPLREYQPMRGAELSVIRESRVRLPLSTGALDDALKTLDRQRLVLRIDDVKPPEDEDVYVQAYLNLPEGEATSTESPYYAGSFAFFTDRTMQRMSYNYIVDLSEVIERLRAGGRLDPASGAHITLVATPVEVGRTARGTVGIGALTPLSIRRLPKPVPPR